MPRTAHIIINGLPDEFSVQALKDAIGARLDEVCVIEADQEVWVQLAVEDVLVRVL